MQLLTQAGAKDAPAGRGLHRDLGLQLGERVHRLVRRAVLLADADRAVRPVLTDLMHSGTEDVVIDVREMDSMLVEERKEREQIAGVGRKGAFHIHPHERGVISPEDGHLETFGEFPVADVGKHTRGVEVVPLGEVHDIANLELPVTARESSGTSMSLRPPSA